MSDQDYKKVVKVLVKGTSGCGKSAVVQLIAEALAKAGLDCYAAIAEHDARSESDLQQAVAGMQATKTLIAIEDAGSTTIYDISAVAWDKAVQDAVSGKTHYSYRINGAQIAIPVPEDPIAAYDRAMKAIR